MKHIFRRRTAANAMRAAFDRVGVPAVRRLMQDLGYQNLNAVPEDRLPAFIKAVNKLQPEATEHARPCLDPEP